jgi:hypothetical protein
MGNYRFKLRKHQHKTSKIIFYSSWFTADDYLGAIFIKDHFLKNNPEFKDCYITWEQK